MVIKCHFTSRSPSHSARAFGGSQYCLVSIVSKEENKTLAISAPTRLADMGDPPAAAAPNRSDVELVVASAGPRRQSRVSVSAAAFVVGLGLLVLALTPPKTEPAALVARYDERVYRAYLDKGLGGDALPGLAPAVDTITANGIRWAAASDAQAAAAVQARIQSSKRTNAAVSAASSAVRRATASVAQRATIDGCAPFELKMVPRCGG